MDVSPSPKLSREGWSGVCSGLQRGESVAVVIINHPPSPISWCSHVRILFLSTPLSLNMLTYFPISASAIGQVRSKLGGVDTSILHHAFISIFIALWAVITRYVTVLMAILSYFTRFIMKREDAGSWNSGWKRSKYWKPILHSSKNPETPRK